MKSIFKSATFKLTAWYLLLIACISLMFSVIVYQISIGEVDRRLESYQQQTHSPALNPITDFLQQHDKIRLQELSDAKSTVLGVLIYVNLTVWIGGGILSYLLAQRTLRPIEEAHDQQVRFTSDASHELRTPLATMQTELEVALRDPKLTKSEMRSLLSSNLEEVQRLSKLSKILLALSSGKDVPLDQKSFSLSEVTKAIVKRLDPKTKRIKLKIDKQPVLVKGNRQSIEELISILLENALKYSPPDSEIKINLSRQSHFVRFKISNSGQGIQAEDLPHIFDRFYRADRARNSEGYGLGLALAKQICDIHHTELRVKSQPGKLTEFSFCLPIY